MHHKTFSILLAVVLSAGICGCGGRSGQSMKEYQTPTGQESRNTELARDNNAKAIALIKKSDLGAAEKELKAALTADSFFGPAHNNLGIVYYRQKNYYLAAWEFQYAVKLMPGKAEPKNNLGMVYEAVGRRNDAAKYYQEALAIDDDCVETMTNLARVYVRDNRKDEKTRKLLEEIVLKDARPEWASWAREKLALLGGNPSPTGGPVDGNSK